MFRSIDALATWLWNWARLSQGPPAPLVGLARSLGATTVIYREGLPEDGRVEVRGTDIIVLVRSHRSLGRRRFTLAHEIGHLVLAQPNLRLAPLRRRERLLDDEQFCDRLAEALIMPSAWVAAYAQRPQTLETLRDCAQRAEVSFAAASVRLARVAGWQRLLLRWVRDEPDWQLQSATGYLPARRHAINTGPATIRLLDEWAQRPSSNGAGWLPLMIDARPCLVKGEWAVHARTSLALVDPTCIRPAEEAAVFQQMTTASPGRDEPRAADAMSARHGLTYLTAAQGKEH